MPLDWTLIGWSAFLIVLSASAAAIGRLTATLFVRASGSRISRRRA